MISDISDVHFVPINARVCWDMPRLRNVVARKSKAEPIEMWETRAYWFIR